MIAHGRTAAGGSTSWPSGPGSRSTRSATTPARASCSPPVKQGRQPALRRPSTSSGSTGSASSRTSGSRSPRSGPSSTSTAPASKASSPPPAASYTLAELTERSGVDDRARRAACARSGCSPTRPSSAARPTTTPTSRCSRAVAELRSIGMTPEILLALGRIYVDHFGALQHDVLDMLSGKRQPGVGRRRARARSSSSSPRTRSA